MALPTCKQTLDDVKDQIKQDIKDKKLNKDDAYKYCELEGLMESRSVSVNSLM